jgi:isopenicillin N synthase-like dioxygenase
LGEPPDHFDAEYAEDTHVMRVLHYPAFDRHAAGGKPCSSHTDQGSFTLLKQDRVGGLEALLAGADGEVWTPVPPKPGALTVNIGDTMCAWTAGKYISTVHRVVPSATGAARLSCGFFYDPSAGSPMVRGEVAAKATADTSAAGGVLYNRGIRNLLHKAGLDQSPAGVAELSALSFAEYKHRVFTKYQPDAVPHTKAA